MPAGVWLSCLPKLLKQHITVILVFIKAYLLWLLAISSRALCPLLSLWNVSVKYFTHRSFRLFSWFIATEFLRAFPLVLVSSFSHKSYCNLSPSQTRVLFLLIEQHCLKGQCQFWWSSYFWIFLYLSFFLSLFIPLSQPLSPLLWYFDIILFF